MDDVAFLAEFDPVTEEDWLHAVRRVLLRRTPDADDEAFAAAFDRELRHVTEDGIVIEPLYTMQRRGPIPSEPGREPYVRADHAAPRPWEIRQQVWPGIDGSDAVTELENGATGVLVEAPADLDRAGLAEVLDGVYLDLAPVSLATPGVDPGTTAATALLELWSDRDVAPPEPRGSLGIDPIGAWARRGGTGSLDHDLDAAAAVVVRAASEAPHARALVADGTLWHDAGATTGQELAWTTAVAVAAVRELVDRGVPVADATRTIEFRWAADADQFTTIAKLRAARRVWARVTEIAGLQPQPQAQHAMTSQRMSTTYDPWVNALRATLACFGAAVGGADALTVRPHDLLRTVGGSPLGRRLARNTQSILLSECNLAHVVDPAGGSWYVEYLTDQLATTAWTELRRLDEAGGIVAGLLDGSIHAALEAARTARDAEVADRRRPLTGLSEFPDIDEPVPPATVDVRTDPGAPTRFAPLTLHRLADGFEAQRRRADRHEQATGTRPLVRLATLGAPAVHTPRLTFAQNLFAAAGIRTIAGTPDELAGMPTAVACLCSSDAVYRDEGAEAAAALRTAGATRVVVAGRGLELDGVDEEIGLGVDALSFLTRTLDALGVDP